MSKTLKEKIHKMIDEIESTAILRIVYQFLKGLLG